MKSNNLHLSIRSFYLLIASFCFLFGISNQAQAKDFHIITSDSIPLPGATLSVISPNDSTIIESAIANNLGITTINVQLNDNDLLYAYLYGYKPYRNTVADSGSTIILEPDATTLGELVVSASADHVKVEAGKLTFTPGDLKTQVTDMTGLLKFTPLLKVSEDEIGFFMKPAKVYLNGVELPYPQNYLMMFLNTINPKDVTSIELQPNGNTTYPHYGIINIIMPDPTKGLKGTLHATGNYESSRFSTRDRVSLNYAKGKFVADFIADYRFNNRYSHKSADYLYPDENKEVNEDSRSSSRSHNLMGQIKLGYKYSDRSNLNLWVGLTTMKSDSHNDVNSTTSCSGISESSTFRSSFNIPWVRPLIRAIAYWTYTTDSKGSLIDISADYYDYNNQYNQEYTYYNEAVVMTQKKLTRGEHGCVAYTHHFSSSQTMTAKYELTDYNLHDVAEYPHSLPGMDFVNSDFKYKELKNEARLSWRGEWNEYIKTSASLHYSNSNLKIDRISSGKDLDRNYNLFQPYISLSFLIPKSNQTIDFSGGYAEVQPDYRYLDPQKIWSSPTVYYKGNPNLKPTKGWSINLDYSLLGCFFVRTMLGRSTNEIVDYDYADNGYTIISYTNIGSKLDAYIHAQFIKTFRNFWRVNLSAMATYDCFRGNIGNANLDYDHLRFIGSINNMFTISRKYNTQAGLSYQFMSKSRTITSSCPAYHALSADISKIFNNGMSISFSAHNLLAQKQKINFISSGYEYHTIQLGCPLSFSLTFDYTFGKKQVYTGYTRNVTKLEQ